MDEVEVTRTADPFHGADPSSSGIEHTMMLIAGDGLAPTLNPYVETDSRDRAQYAIDEQTIQRYVEHSYFPLLVPSLCNADRRIASKSLHAYECYGRI